MLDQVYFRKMVLFLRPNLELKGRILRASLALILAIAAPAVWPLSRVAALGLAASAVFVAFEAARGWCALRACGLKTNF